MHVCVGTKSITYHLSHTSNTSQTHLKHTSTHLNTPPTHLQHTSTHLNTFKHTSTHSNTPQTHSNTPQHIQTHINTFKHTSNTPQHTSTHSNAPASAALSRNVPASCSMGGPRGTVVADSNHTTEGSLRLTSFSSGKSKQNALNSR